MHKLDYSEFYITNVCNLNCPGCNRFNNFAFKGHFKWQDHAHLYKKWSKILDLKQIGILGGEPFLNKDLPNFIQGIAEYWPDSEIVVITNGTQFQNNKHIYDLIKQYKGRVYISVSCHNRLEHQELLNQAKNFLSNIIEETPIYYNTWKDNYNAIKDPSWPDCNTPEEFYQLPNLIQQECLEDHALHPATQLVDNNNVRLEFFITNHFENSTLIFDQQSLELTLHKSDPDQAMSICSFKKCHHFIHGKLYKCGPVGILPDFVKQFEVKIDDEQKQLIESYRAAEHDWNEAQLTQYIDNLANTKSIPQCSLCPSNKESHLFKATSKKIKIRQIS